MAESRISSHSRYRGARYLDHRASGRLGSEERISLSLLLANKWLKSSLVEAFSKVKRLLRVIGARTKDALVDRGPGGTRRQRPCVK